MPAKSVTANRLDDGIAIFFTPEGTWSERPQDAAWEEDKEAQKDLLTRAEACPEAVAPYLIDVSIDSGAPYPTRYREIIRALGPTVRPDLGKQAESGTPADLKD